jgi:CubicO group peptidase (beta-lactamase class C family)
MKSLFSLLLGMIFVLPNPQPVFQNQKKLDQLFTELQARGNFNGNVIVARQGEILYQKSFGFADYASQRMLNDSSVFELASVSKQFTAMGIMLLEEAGKLTYEDTVSQYFGDFPYPEVTIRHLLTHTSGIDDYIYHGDHWDPDQIATNQDVLAFYQEQKPALKFATGDAFSYANTNYVLLAEIIKQVTGQEYGEFLAENIFEPLGMRRTRTYQRWAEEEDLDNYAVPHVSYTDHENKTVYVDPVKTHLYPLLVASSGIEGDGNIVSTTADLVAYYEAVRTHQLVSAKTLQAAFSPTPLNDGSLSWYGFGMYLSQKGEKNWHWGSWPGLQTSYTFFPEDGTIAIYLKNVESQDWSWVRKWEKLARG